MRQLFIDILVMTRIEPTEGTLSGLRLEKNIAGIAVPGRERGRAAPALSIDISPSALGPEAAAANSPFS